MQTADSRKEAVCGRSERVTVLSEEGGADDGRECGSPKGMGRAVERWYREAWEHDCETERRRDTDEGQPRQSGIEEWRLGPERTLATGIARGKGD